MDTHTYGPKRALVIGDIQGQADAFKAFLASDLYGEAVCQGVPIIFTGDLVDSCENATNNLACLYLMLNEVEEGRVIWVAGNHDKALYQLICWVEGMLGGTASPADYTLRPYQQGIFDELMTLDRAAFTALARRLKAVYEKLPGFVRVNNLYVSHGGWTNAMLAAERPQACISLKAFHGVFTARLSEQAAKGAMFGTWRHGKLISPQQGRHLVVGHHFGSRHGTPADVVCVDTGCGKGGTLSATMFCTGTATALRCDTFA